MRISFSKKSCTLEKMFEHQDKPGGQMGRLLGDHTEGGKKYKRCKEEMEQ